MSSEIMVGRQPIFDRNYQVVAYEILYQGVHPVMGDEMTAQVVADTLTTLGLENVAGALPIYFNIDESFLLNKAELTHILPPGQIHFELLQTIQPTAEVLEACRRLKDEGYNLALDNVTNVEHARAFIDYVDIIKVDWVNCNDPAKIYKEFRCHDVKFLAEKIDSYEDAEAAKNLNVDFYQGYFFCKPNTVSGKRQPESRMAILRAMQQAMVATSIDDMFDVVRQDISLSYRLLKYINTAAFALRREIQSVEQALALLGLKNVRRWLVLLSMTSLGEDKPNELIRQALWRAHFLEMMARELGEKVIEDDFLTGLFSILDALLDCPMKESLGEVSLAGHVHDGLIDTNSAMGKKLAVARALELGDWDLIREFSEDGRRIKYTDITRLQTEAMHWADQQMLGLSTV